MLRIEPHPPPATTGKGGETPFTSDGATAGNAWGALSCRGGIKGNATKWNIASHWKDTMKGFATPALRLQPR